jgi:hypothetical protein
VAIQLALDVSELPKPIQVSAMSSDEWRLSSGWNKFVFHAEAK